LINGIYQGSRFEYHSLYQTDDLKSTTKKIAHGFIVSYVSKNI